MQILLANAKIMFDKADRAAVSKPLFQSVAEMLAAEMAKLDVEELARQLDCSHKIASENWKRYRNFMAAEKMPAILSYNGQAYKHLRANTLEKNPCSMPRNISGLPAFSMDCFGRWMASCLIVWSIA